MQISLTRGLVGVAASGSYLPTTRAWRSCTWERPFLFQDCRQKAKNLARRHCLQSDGSGKAFEGRFGRKRLSEPNSPRANYPRYGWSNGCPARQSSGPSKVLILGHLRSHHHNIPIPPAREGKPCRKSICDCPSQSSGWESPALRSNDPGEGRVAAEVKPGVIT